MPRGFSRSGASAAAPIVSGSVALLAQHYRDQLGNDEIVTRLLRTANKEGIYYELRARLDHGAAKPGAFPGWRETGRYNWSGVELGYARLFPGLVPTGPQLGSLSLVRRFDAGEFFFSVRNHPGWRFGLYGLEHAAGQAHVAALFSRDAGHVRGQQDIALLMQYRRSY